MIKQRIIVTLCIGMLLLTGCSETKNSNAKIESTSSSDTQPVLYNLGGVHLPDDVEFNAKSLDVANGKTVAVFLFGQPLPQNPGEPQRINPNLEFGGLTQPIELVSAIDGVVGFIQQQPDSNDYEVFLMTEENSQWVIGYDHVTDVQVTRGQTIAVGDVIGKAAPENNGYYRYELQINAENGDDTVMYCPTDLLDDSVQTDIKTTLDAFVTDWDIQYRAAFGTTAYPTQSGGCTKPTVTNAESQGQ